MKILKNREQIIEYLKKKGWKEEIEDYHYESPSGIIVRDRRYFWYSCERESCRHGYLAAYRKQLEYEKEVAPQQLKLF